MIDDTIYPSDRLAAIETRLARIEVLLSSLGRERSAGYVYLVGDGAGRYKIGKAIDPHERLKGIKTGNSTADLILFIETDNRHALERALHQVYRTAGRHLGGEWYALSQADIDTLAMLPSPLFEDELSRVQGISCDAIEIPHRANGGDNSHPSTAEALSLVADTEAARAAALFLAGNDVSVVVLELRGIKSNEGRRYQTAVTEVQQLIREGLGWKGAA